MEQHWRCQRWWSLVGLAGITLVRIIASREQATAEFKARGELGSMAMKPDDELRGAAFHEAGHVIVAREFRLPVGEIAIGIDGDDAIGRAEIGSAHHLPLINQIALCVAGVVAQSVFNWPTHKFAGAGDYARVVDLVGGMTDANSLKVRNAAYARAREILGRRAGDVERLAKRLLKHRRIT